MHIAELISLILLSLLGGMYWGPWLALTRSLKKVSPEFLLQVTHLLSKNMAVVMTPLTPLALASIVPVLVLSYSEHRTTFFLSLIALILFAFTLLVTMLIEVPIVRQIESWSSDKLPVDWEQKRNRWQAFHYLRVVPAIIGLGLMIYGALLT